MGLRKILLGLVLASGCAVAAPVMTADGPVAGIGKSGVMQYLGIAYAAPPVGALRWMPPQPAAKWSAVKKADAFGPTCAQVTTLGPFAGPPNSNEDCLYLNVFTPPGAKKLPVLVWIHGGGYVDGESNDYDGSRLARQGKLVVVTINYRLNLFGFLAVPALDPGGKSGGNYGVLDMQAALRWVHANIAAFGGDPGNVTVGGQSAGAGAAMAQVVSPGATGLIHRAILQSGGYTPFAKKETALAHGEKFVAAAGCDHAADIAACLRALPADKIVALAGTASATSGLVTNPNVDGTVIPLQTIDAIESGAFNKVPIMIGTTRDEGNFFNGIAQYFKPDRAPIEKEDYLAYLKSSYGGNAGPGGSGPAYPKETIDEILKVYPVGTPSDVIVRKNPDGSNITPKPSMSVVRYSSFGPATPQMAWDGVHSDMLACRGQHIAYALSKTVPVYQYIFNDRTAPSYFPVMAGYQPLAYHTSDIQYLFVGFHGGPDGVSTKLSAKQERLSNHMIAAWANFARLGNPNGSGNKPWPRWSDGPSFMSQDDYWGYDKLNNARGFLDIHFCSLWDSYLLYR